MKNFKLLPGIQPVHPINKDVFEEKTNKKRPYFVEGDKCYGVCPQCDNPIQIIGLYKNIKYAPHGKHYPHSISIANYNQQAYEYCPYRAENRVYEQNARKRELTEYERNVYQLLRDNFDSAIYILSKSIDIHITAALAERILTSFVNHEAWMYPGTSLNNIPWMLGYFFPAESLYKKLIKTDSELYKCLLENCPEIYFEEAEYYQGYSILKTNQWISLSYTLILHNRDVKDDLLREKLLFRVFKQTDIGEETIYENDMSIDETYFLNLIHSDTRYRKETLLDIADRIMPLELIR